MNPISPAAADGLAVLLILTCAALAAYCFLALRRERIGMEMHAHADGTVHEHHRGSAPHNHPTWADRHERRVARLFGEND